MPTTIEAQVAHDTTLLELLGTLTQCQDRRANAVRYTMSDVARNQDWYGSNRSVAQRRYTDADGKPVGVDDAKAVLMVLAETGPLYGGYKEITAKQAADYLERLDKTSTALAEAMLAVERHEVNYTGWPRFFLVTSSPGHVHSTMGCTSCFNTTRFAPLPSLSGTDAAAAVRLLGDALCTVCFPDAPVKPAKITQAQAVKLVEEGEQAFLDMRAKAAAKKAAKK